MTAGTEAAAIVYWLQAIATLLVAVVGWFIKRTLDRLDAHLDRVEEKQEAHHGRISHLEGWQHSAAPAWTRRPDGKSQN